jgi:hypothetical protein
VEVGNKLFIFSLIALALTSQVCAGLIINEIMAAPVSDESLNEWIELYNNRDQEINVSDFKIGDEEDTDILEGGLFDGGGTIIPPYGYALVTDEATRVYNNFKCSGDAIRLYVDDSSIGNGLKNSGESIFLYDKEDQLLDNVTYGESVTGLSFALFNGSWGQANSTPGYINNGSIIYPTKTTGCDWQIGILLDKTVFESDEEFEWKMLATKISGNSTTLTGRARIEDMFGTVIKEYKPWTNESATYKKTSSAYSPNLEKAKSYLITAYLQTGCDDKNPENNMAQELVTLQGVPLENNSRIEIEDVYDLGTDDIAKFGQTIRVRLGIYKGDTQKNTVTAKIESDEDKVSKDSKANVYDKFKETIITLPIQIKPNCNYDYEDGVYNIVVEGLDQRQERQIEIEDITDSLCETKIVEKSTKSSDFYFELEDWPLEIEDNKEFEIQAKIYNNDDTAHEIDIWSYVYRGSKSYSGEREANLKHLAIKSESEREITLRNIVQEAEPGDYNLMVKLIKDEQTTEKKISKTIKVIQPVIAEGFQTSEEKITVHEKEQEPYTVLESTKEPQTVYESTTVKAKNLTIYFFTGLLVLYAVFITLKR